MAHVAPTAPAAVPALMARFAVVVFATAFAAIATAQERAFDGWAAIGDEGYAFDPDSSEVATFSIQVSGEVRFRFHQAAGAMKEGSWRAAAEPLQEIIDLFPNHLYQVARTRWVGAAEHARFLLRSFPPEGRDQYAEWAQLRAAPALRGALQDGDERRLEKIAWQWSVTPQGLAAMKTLGDMAQERGHHELAARWYRRRLAFEEPGSPATSAIALRAAAALTFAGDQETARALVAPHDGVSLPVAGEAREVTKAWQDLTAWGPPPDTDWPIFGGAPHHAARVRADADLELQRGWVTPTFSRPGSSPFRASRGDQDFPFHPIIAGGSMFLADGLSVRAFSLFSEEARWRYEGPLFDPALPDDYYFFDDYTRDPQRGPLGSLARALPLSATAADGVVVAPLMDLRPRGVRISFDRNDITIPIPKRSLYAVDAETGELRWRQVRPKLAADAFVNRLSVSAPPVIVDDRVLAVGYVLEGAINLFAACFSLEDGELLWKTPIVVGQQELTMFNKPFKEFTVQMAAERDGAVYVCSNLGLFAALDTMSGHVRWVMQYESIPIMGALHYSQHRERSTTSANDAPVVADGVVIFSPFDSNNIYAVDVATGKRLWQQSANAGRDPPARYSHVLGVDDGVAVLSGRYGVGFFDVRTGEFEGQYTFGATKDPVTNPVRNPYPRGRGCLGEGMVYQPLYDRLLVLRWKRSSFGVEVTDDEYLEWSQEHAGNFVRGGGVDVVASREALTVFFDVDALAAEARLRVTGDAATIADLILLGQLESKRQDYAAGIAAFGRALRHPDLDEERRRRIHDGLHRAHRQLARYAKENDDAVARLEHLRAEGRYAPDAHAFLLVAEQLLDLHDAAGDRDAYVALLDWMDERAGEVDYPFRGLPHRGLVRTSLFTLERRASIELSRERPEAAVAAWQEMIRRHPELPFDGRSAREYAVLRIAKAIAQYGPEVYAPFEKEAAERHAAALAERDHASLAAVIERFPNSTRTTRYRIDLARLQLEAGLAEDLFRTLGPLLDGETRPEDRAEALALLARGAEAAGETRLAGAVWRRLEQLGVDLPASGGEGVSYGSLAAAEAARIGATEPGDDDQPVLRAAPSLRGVDFPLDNDRDTRIVEVDARGADGIEGVLVYEVERTADVVRATVRLLDTSRPADVRERWRLPVDVYFHDADPVRAFLLGERLVIRQQRTFRGVDPSDGTLLFTTTLARAPTFVQAESGLLQVLWHTNDGGSQLAALELATGSAFWERHLDGGVSDVESGGGLALVRTDDAMLHAFDALTGTPRYTVSLLEIPRGSEIRAFPRFGIFVATGIGEDARRGKLIAFDLQDGRRLWERPDLSFRLGVDWLHEAGERLVLLSATTIVGGAARGVLALDVLEPRSGRVLRTADRLPKLSAIERGPVVVGGHAVFVREGRRSRVRRTTAEALVVVDLETGERGEVPLQGLPSDRHAEFDGFASRDGRLCGTVDATGVLPTNGCESFVFVLDPAQRTFEVVRIESDYDIYRSLPTATPGSLAVLKDDRLWIYPSEPIGREK